MKVIVFGATGGIGKQVVKIALEKGYDVVAYVRNPSKIDFKDDKLSIVKGEITDFVEIKKAIQGCDAVINCIGLSMKPFEKDYPAVIATKLIIKAMKEEGIKRYITWATPSVKAPGDEKSYITVLPSLMAGLFLPGAKKALVSIANDIEKSGLEWTIVRFMAPNNNAPSKMTATIEFTDEISKEDIWENLKKMPYSPQYITHKYNQYTYPIQSQDTVEMIKSLKAYLSNKGFYMTGRFADWEYYNMDVAIKAAMSLCDIIK